MGLLLDFVYLIACLSISPWLAYRWCAGDGRDLRLRFGVGLGEPLHGSIWLHGSSAGEISLLRPLVALLERDFPDSPIVISAFTSSGLATARKLFEKHRVLPLPLDFSFVVREALRKFDPRALIVVESEFWPNLIAGARRLGVPVVIVNGKMSAKSFRLHSRTGLIGRVLREIDLVAVQTEEHAGRLRSLGVPKERVAVTGNMKYDLTRPAADEREATALRASLGYSHDDVVLIGGSLHEREDEAMLDAYAAARAVASEVALIIVPRYTAHVPDVERKARARGYSVTRKTDVDRGAAVAPGRDGILVVDTLGELGRLYAVADIAFVGGSLYFRGSNKGGHNLMEPAILGVPVVFGPYNFSFKETVDDLLAAHAGKLGRDASELAAVVVALVEDPAERRALGERAREVVRAGQGATSRNFALLAGLLRAKR
jgi:3-deoxy-D-manno-octulosonic-acid transferase